MISGGSDTGAVTTSGSTGYFTAAGDWAGTTYVVLTDSAGDKVYATVTITGGATASSGALAISPSSASVVEGATYTFTASGGSGSGYAFSIASGGGVVTKAGAYTAPTNSTGTATLTLEDSDGNTATAVITITASSVALNTVPIGTFCGNYDFDAYSFVINSIDCNGMSLTSGTCPVGYTYEVYADSDGNYAATCVATTAGLTTPSGAFCGSYNLSQSNNAVVDSIPCNGVSLANSTCPSGYTYEPYFQADGNIASTCVASTAGAAMDTGSFCGSYDVDAAKGGINSIDCNGSSIASGTCPSGYTYTKYFQADGDTVSTSS